ncbi:DNA-processing protein DprA [Virgibacillus sp. NKC19-3]|uniref:DNA-processing protein DprA n=1 Tax=Virgibacillus saliphilus TaxID=2831674 RepID=UPI001C9A8753|nr:DNA-processing protein DprA [Virgibacillus sp. NKC19-3]MBY7143648.1 DNA-processing protein DprA [Virgibacillus sp. NKC19-3]
MQSIRDKLIYLHRCRGITRRIIRKILFHDPKLHQLYLLSSSQISQLYKLPIKNAALFYKDLHNNYLTEQIKYDREIYSIITIVDEDYPPVLKTIKDPPIVLYGAGNRSLLSHVPSLSVIGTRDPSNEAMTKIKYLTNPLLDKNWLIVSGMAKGIDSYAHIHALKNEGNTIAVLGGGFEHIYPKQNTALFKQIVEKGLVLSEYPPDIPPKKHHFPERNRIISGLSFGTLVIEATEKSGTLITVDQALDQGREVYAAPGSLMVPQTKGCHRMIQDGAKLTMDPDDILEDWKSIGRNLFYV